MSSFFTKFLYLISAISTLKECKSDTLKEYLSNGLPAFNQKALEAHLSFTGSNLDFTSPYLMFLLSTLAMIPFPDGPVSELRQFSNLPSLPNDLQTNKLCYLEICKHLQEQLRKASLKTHVHMFIDGVKKQEYSIPDSYMKLYHVLADVETTNLNKFKDTINRFFEDETVGMISADDAGRMVGDNSLTVYIASLQGNFSFAYEKNLGEEGMFLQLGKGVRYFGDKEKGVKGAFIDLSCGNTKVNSLKLAVIESEEKKLDYKEFVKRLETVDLHSEYAVSRENRSRAVILPAFRKVQGNKYFAETWRRMGVHKIFEGVSGKEFLGRDIPIYNDSPEMFASVKIEKNGSFKFGVIGAEGKEFGMDANKAKWSGDNLYLSLWHKDLQLSVLDILFEKADDGEYIDGEIIQSEFGERKKFEGEGGKSDSDKPSGMSTFNYLVILVCFIGPIYYYQEEIKGMLKRYENERPLSPSFQKFSELGVE